jgi:hypothetical protein
VVGEAWIRLVLSCTELKEDAGVRIYGDAYAVSPAWKSRRGVSASCVLVVEGWACSSAATIT